MTRRKTTPSAGQQSPTELALVAILTGTVRLNGAACIGHANLFDPPGDGEPGTAVDARHRAAARLCWTCPVLDECRTWAEGEPSSHTVIAAQVMSAPPSADITDTGAPDPPRIEQTA
ncbi:WhiB family transcriptional regulator [Rhodococcus sp. EPR-157]|uniref:WhiB family transcriptional regulator n=1 Tax=Rhodococcus sp. EPR-157 TaxID=1813677 RepID=UPI000839A534|nr:WhiB family transcriptional regulator [Rhodococcus sp. EPR-157]